MSDTTTSIHYPKVIIALDYSNKKSAMKLINDLNPKLYKLKIGKEIFIRLGVNFIHELHNLGFNIFLDLKFHDIPNTVAQAVRAAADLGVWMISVHACGGIDMLQAAKYALNNFKSHTPLLMAVTVLTSFSELDLKRIGVTLSLSDYVLKLSKIVKESNLDGVICPGRESKNIKDIFGNDFKTVIPGIRLPKNSKNDQKLVITPKEIKQFSSDYIVVGRSVTQSRNPMKILNNILNDIMI
ncbi:Orotidine 5'-phosphate decarboxylase [Buchnera aphidicola (Phyllaphis fagi)]|uniref:orotidine-5'-phosphate decarboxylase n=1 Tax=Buchnera aphidicola TaxID=9 RepID=UPI00346431E4